MIVDVHEPESMVAALRGLGVDVEVRAITPGDYVIGPVGIERKTLTDFFASIVQRRLFEQVIRLRETYPLSLLLVEGDLATVAKAKNPAAFWGAFSAVTLAERVPILFTPDQAQTALSLRTIERQFSKGALDYGVRHKPKSTSLEDRQRIVLEGLPGVGAATVRQLLAHFGTVRRTFAASEARLQRVEGIGPKRAREITAVLDHRQPRKAPGVEVEAP